MNDPVPQKALRYLVAGGTATLVHLAVLAVLVESFGWGELVSTSIGFLCAIPVNFHLQRTWVFKSNGPYVNEFTKYLLVTVSTFLLNGLIFALLHSQLGIQYLVAQLMTTAVVLLANFTINFFFTFSARHAK
ncbi:MAG: GtrA family protein [Pseudomonadota bacterium]